MAEIVVMPKAGNSVETCLLTEWKVKVGDTVSKGDILLEAETDKASIEVESTADGVLLAQLFKEDDDVPVMEGIAIIGAEGEDISSLVSGGAAEAASAEETPQAPEPSSAPAPAAAPVSAAPVSSGVGVSPRARSLASANGLPTVGIGGTGPGGRVIERDVKSALAGREPLTPAARALAAESGLSVPASGTGLGGRVRAGDLGTAAPSVQAAAAPAPQAEITDVPVKGIRKIIADRMKGSLDSTAQLTLHSSADAVRMLSLRKTFKNAADDSFKGITINDLVLYAAIKTLKKYPDLNAHFLGNTIRKFGSVNLGMAVDTPKGLMVPVIKNADSLSLKELAAESSRLAKACQEGKILPEELQGGTFTVTNLGGMGIEQFTPVLNAPEVGILGLGTIKPQPVMNGADVSFVPHMFLSLTFDHQANDGAPAARFLKDLAYGLKNFDLLLAE